MKNLLFVSILLISFQCFSQDIGFAAGSDFKAYHVKGNLTYHCSNQTFLYQCSDWVLTPAEASYFNFPGYNEDKLTLKCTQNSGKVVTKNLTFNIEKQRTKFRVNLWIASLTQRPLFDLGLNQIEVYSSNEQLVHSFSIDIPHESRTCRHRVLYDDMCAGEYSACQRYFDEENYCL